MNNCNIVANKNMDKNALLLFLLGKGPNQEGTTINQVLEYSIYELENDHHYIQWCFPTNEVSEHAPSVAITKDDVLQWYSNSSDEMIIKDNVYKVYSKMLKFYGFEYDDLGILRNTKHPFTINFGWDHNRLRITRILKSLRLLGLDQQADDFFEALVKVYNEYSWRFNKESVRYWFAAVAQ